MLSMLFSLTLTTLLLAASALDLVRFRIPNMIPLALIGLFVLKAISITSGHAWSAHLASFGLLLLLGFLAFAGGLLGGGDAKLLASLGLWFGPSHLPSLILITGISGGILALVLLTVRHLRKATLATAGATTREAPIASAPSLLDPGAPAPYAVPMSFAALWLEWL